MSNPSIKILFLTHSFEPYVGGIETNAEILAGAFHHFGAEVHLVTWQKGPSKKNFSYEVIRNPGTVQLIKEHRWADVVFENNPCLQLSWPNIFFRKPLVVALNTWVSRIKGQKGLKDKLKYYWFRRAKTIITVSNAVRLKEWPAATVIENPYKADLFKIMPEISKTINFVFLGRLVSDKGANQAIAALSILIKQNVLNGNIQQLTIIGDGTEKEALQLQVKNSGLNGCVHFNGILEDEALVECLNKHTYILVPSAWEEPYGNVVLEGMACGCIPIASNGGGLSEAVGNGGVLFERNNLAALAKAMQAAVTQPGFSERYTGEVAAHLQQHLPGAVAEKYFIILKKAAGLK